MSKFRKFTIWVSGTVAFAGVTAAVKQSFFTDRHAKRMEAHVQLASQNINKRVKSVLPTRQEQLQRLKDDEFDVLVIGGGATGSGCALDAATRGLKTGLVELDDFSSGTSSRSTKLIHGGVRYLQKAIFNLDYEQYKMVQEALHERANLLAIAPHLSFPLPIMLPVYQFWKLPYFLAGIKAYDLVSGQECLKNSFVLGKERALELFPMLKRDKLKGAIVYYDGSHNDARMCISIAISAARQGAAIANHVKVTDLVKNDEGRIVGAKMRDQLTGDTWITKAKSVVNATGPFTDSIRKMDDQDIPEIVCPSAGVHIILPNYYSPEKMGLIDPETSDGRVIFLLPWQNSTIAGTTDSPCEVTHSPNPTEKDIKFILDEVRHYLTSDLDVRRADVQSAWSGIRPLVKDPNAKDTQSLVRNHVIHVSPESGLVTIAGGKWTTYRAMAEETITAAVESCNLEPTSESKTDGLLLEGAHTWTPTMHIKLVQDLGVDDVVAQHLSETYGDRAFEVGRNASMTGLRWPVVGKRLNPEYPYIEGEIRYAVKREYAATAIDILARRLRISFLNVQAAEEALPRVIEIMSEELGWSKEEMQRQTDDAIEFLSAQMGKQVNKTMKDAVEINLSKGEIKEYVKRFNALDYEKKGFVSTNDIKNSLEQLGRHISGKVLREIITEIDTNNNGQVELDEYLQLMSAIKTGKIAHSRFDQLAEQQLAEQNSHSKSNAYGGKIERSGGGI